MTNTELTPEGFEALIEQMISRRMTNTGETRQESSQFILDYLRPQAKTYGVY